jgi:general secretion pathway protein L
MLKEILTWWWQQMRDLLPQRWRNSESDHAGALLVEPIENDQALRFRFPGRGNQRESEPFPLTAAGISQMRPVLARLKPKSCILMLPEQRLLERSVTLPLAAERDVQQIMVFEMDRLTPFAASELFWRTTLTRRNRTAGRIELLLSLVPRASVEPLLTVMAQAGLRPQTLQVEMPDGQRRVIALERSASKRAMWERRAATAALALCALFALTAVGLPFVLRMQEARDVRQRIATLRAEVAEVEALRRDIAAQMAGGDAMAARRLQNVDPLGVLAEVTEALPDDTYLFEFALDHGRLSITGQSAAAAKLISTLAANPHIRNPGFSAPVTRNEAAHTDLFSIHAEVTP